MFTRKTLQWVGLLMVVMTFVLATGMAARVAPASGAADSSLRQRSCGMGRVKTYDPDKAEVLLKSAPRSSHPSARKQEVELSMLALSQYEPVLTSLIQGFESEHPAITIQVSYHDSSNFNDVLFTMTASGTTPDLILGPSTLIETLYENGVIAPLSDSLPYGLLWDSSQASCNCAGRYYGFPVSVFNLALFYNRDVFDAAGVGYPDPGWSFEILQSVFSNFANMGKYGLAVQTGSGYFFYPLTTGFGGSIFGEEWPQVVLDGEGSVNALAWAKDMIDQGYMPGDASYDDVMNLFISGQAAMILGGPWNIQQFQDAGVSFGITGFPSKGYPLVSTDALMVSSMSEYPDEAFAFVDYVSRVDNLQSISDSTGQASPLRVDRISDGDPLLVQLAFAGQGGSKMPYLATQSIVFGSWDPAIAQVFSGQASPQNALDQAANAIRSEIGH